MSNELDDYGIELAPEKPNQSAPQKETKAVIEEKKAESSDPGKTTQLSDDEEDMFETEKVVGGKVVSPATELTKEVKEKPVNASAPVKQSVPDESDEEEDPYAESTQVVNKAEDIDKAMADLAIDNSFRPRDVMAIFTGNDFLYLDFKAESWQIGDVSTNEGDNSPKFVIPENASIVRLDDKNTGQQHSNFIVLGGCFVNGDLLDWHFGVKVTQNNSGIGLDIGYSNMDWVLPMGRMMHEACLV